MPEESHRRGATLVMVAILLVAFLGVGAVAADIGRFYAVTTELQTAADAAALAGALTLQRTTNNPEEPDVDTAVVNFVATTNRANGAPLSVTPASIRTAIYTPPNRPSRSPLDYDVIARRANAVQVTVAAAPRGIFSQLIGRAANVPLSRTSVAWVANLAGRCVQPWAFPYLELYETVANVTGVAAPAPDLEPRDFVKFLARPAAGRMFVMLGTQASSLRPNDGNWEGFNFQSQLGQSAFISGIVGCVPPILDVPATVGSTLPSQAASYVPWTTSAIQTSGGGYCYRHPPPDAGCYSTTDATSLGVSVSVAWSDPPAGGSPTFRYVGEFIVYCYFTAPSDVCGVRKPGYDDTGYPEGTIIGAMSGIKSRTLAPDDLLGISPSNVQRIVLVR